MTLSLVPANMAHDLEAAILCAVLTDPEFAIGECRDVNLSHRDFTDRRHVLIYGAAMRLAVAKLHVDPLTVSKFLDEHACLAEAGGKDYIAYLIDSVPTTKNVRSHALLLRRAKHAPAEAKARAEQDEQIGAAESFLDLKARDFMRYPWPELDRALGGLSQGRPHWFAAHTGTGKTSLCETLKKHWMLEGRKVYSAGLELLPDELRLVLACRMLGIDHGELFKGNLQTLPSWPTIEADLRREMQRQRVDEFYTEHVRLAPFEFLTADVARQICERAAEWGADVLIVDHTDHLDSEDRGGHDRAESLAVVKILNSLTKSYGLRALFTSQTNREGKANNPLRDHYPIASEMIRHGDHKIMSSAAFCGLRRPIKHDVNKQVKAEAIGDRAKIRALLAEHTMAINVLKDRYGHNSGEDIWLGFYRGEVLPSSGHVITRHSPPNTERSA